MLNYFVISQFLPAVSYIHSFGDKISHHIFLIKLNMMFFEQFN